MSREVKRFPKSRLLRRYETEKGHEAVLKAFFFIGAGCYFLSPRSLAVLSFSAQASRTLCHYLSGEGIIGYQLRGSFRV